MNPFLKKLPIRQAPKAKRKKIAALAAAIGGPKLAVQQVNVADGTPVETDLTFAVGNSQPLHQVVVKINRAVDWIALTPQAARELAGHLLRHAELLEPSPCKETHA